MGVEPDDADVAPDSGYRTDGAHAVAGQDDRERPSTRRLRNRFGYAAHDLERGADLVLLPVPPAHADDLDLMLCALELLDSACVYESVGARPHPDTLVSKVVRNLDERDMHA
jgi:hypothetical protein